MSSLKDLRDWNLMTDIDSKAIGIGFDYSCKLILIWIWNWDNLECMRMKLLKSNIDKL